MSTKKISAQELQNRAIDFAKKHKKNIAQKRTDPKTYPPSAETPISIFMAGSPGAGKTEFSKNLLKALGEIGSSVVRIDGDELREEIPGYNGKNSKLFQGAISLVIEKIHDEVLRKNQNFILDGTLWNYEKAIKNIERSLKKSRLIVIFYIYQQPEIAWEFTQKREIIEGRNIPKKAFIDQFLGAKKSVQKMRLKYGSEILLYLVKKNHKENTIEAMIEVGPTDTVDHYLSPIYTKTSLQKRLTSSL